MFEVGFTELLIIFALALIVLGPERLPKLAAQVGRWVGRARAMARQFREQLESEAQLEQAAGWSRQSNTPPSTSRWEGEAQAHTDTQASTAAEAHSTATSEPEAAAPAPADAVSEPVSAASTPEPTPTEPELAVPTPQRDVAEPSRERES